MQRKTTHPGVARNAACLGKSVRVPLGGAALNRPQHLVGCAILDNEHVLSTGAGRACTGRACAARYRPNRVTYKRIGAVRASSDICANILI